MNKISLFTFLLFCTMFTQASFLFGQEIQLSVVGSAGTYAECSLATMAWTIGEVTIETYSNSEYSFTQGFHQPSSKDGVPVIADFHIPEGFSPNDDETNDFFFIRGIDKYPNNSIEIFNRWGDKVYEARPYINLWDGTTKMGISIGGDDLPVGTYFYIFDFGNGSKKIKGTIYLNR